VLMKGNIASLLDKLSDCPKSETTLRWPKINQVFEDGFIENGASGNQQEQKETAKFEGKKRGKKRKKGG
jgi:hypothetical protein